MKKIIAPRFSCEPIKNGGGGGDYFYCYARLGYEKDLRRVINKTFFYGQKGR